MFRNECVKVFSQGGDFSVMLKRAIAYKERVKNAVNWT